MNAPATGVRRIALLGGESSGKSTLARALADTLDTEWVPEYGRQLWEQVRRTLTVEELVQVGERQIALEQEAEQRCEQDGLAWLVCDTTPLTTLQYCLHDHPGAPAALEAMAQRAYALQVLCTPDFDFVQDGCRRDDSFRREQHEWTRQRLAALGQPSVEVSGATPERVAQVLAALRALPKPKRR